MILKHKDLDIEENPENPFKNCKLSREPYAQILTSIVANYADGFVLAINNEWGTGKTTFVNMWKQHLTKEGYRTLYFNAWENDFDNNPLVAIMSELNTLKDNKNEKLFKSVLQKGATLIKNIAPAVAKAITAHYLGEGTVTAVVGGLTEGGTEILEDEIKQYTNKKESLKEFRKALTEFIAERDNTKPLVFIIDELDRCRPSYAVEVLEQMKHLFSVEGIVFVLSIDKTQLGHAIRGVYGSELINADEYLRRFIDLEYSIPQPSIEDFCTYLYDYYKFDNFFVSVERKSLRGFVGDKNDLLKMAYILFSKSNATLRQVEKIFGLTRLIISTFSNNQAVFPELFFMLIYIKTMKPQLYTKIETNVLSLQELSDAYFELIPVELEDKYGMNFLYVEALLLNSYTNNKAYKGMKQREDEFSFVKSKLEKNTSGDNNLATHLKQLQSSSNRFILGYLINKINLTEPIIR